MSVKNEYPMLKTNLDRILCAAIKFCYLDDKIQLKKQSLRFDEFIKKVKNSPDEKAKKLILEHYSIKYLQDVFEKLEKDLWIQREKS